MTHGIGSEGEEVEALEESRCDSRAGGVSREWGEGVPWLAAYTRPRHEEKVKEFCSERGIEVFLPTHRSWRRWSDRKKLLHLPLFPSYVFIRVDEEARRRAVQAPGFLWYVRTAAGPVRVDESELDAIRRVLASGLEFDPLPNAQVGDEVEVVAGALRGCRGRLLRKDHSTVVLFVSAINGAVRVVLPDTAAIRPVASVRVRPWAVPAMVPLMR